MQYCSLMCEFRNGELTYAATLVRRDAEREGVFLASAFCDGVLFGVREEGVSFGVREEVDVVFFGVLLGVLFDDLLDDLRTGVRCVAVFASSAPSSFQLAA